jgi:hypothetical protein
MGNPLIIGPPCEADGEDGSGEQLVAITPVRTRNMILWSGCMISSLSARLIRPYPLASFVMGEG